MSKKFSLKKSLLIAFAALLSSLLSGCASAPDVPVCVELNPDRGFCTYTISDKDIYVDEQNPLEGKTWWNMRPEMVQVPPPSWAKIKAFIIKTCKQSNNCDSEVTSWDRRLDSIDEKLKAKGQK